MIFGCGLMLQGVQQDLLSQPATVWNYQPEWVSRPASAPYLMARDRKLVLGTDPGTEGKWSIELNLPLNSYDTLEVSYIARGYNAALGRDFFLHLESDSPKPARRYLMDRSAVKSDGEEHLLRFDLKKELPAGTTIKRLVIHVLAAPDRRGIVEFRQLRFSGSPSAAMRVETPLRAKRQGEIGYELSPIDLKKLKSHPTWCGGAAAENYRFFPASGRFVMETNGGEMKWSLPVSVATDEYAYLVLTYRTNNFNNAPGKDFFLHLDTSAMGAAAQGYAVPRDKIVADGEWHTITVDLRKNYGEGSVNQLVFHAVPHEGAPVRIEIGELFFCSESESVEKRPPVRQLSEIRFDADTKIIRRDPQEVTWPQGDDNAFAKRVNKRVRFHVPAAGAVMRWNCIVPAPVSLNSSQILEMRYRAENLMENPDGVIFVGWNVINDTVPENMRPVKFNNFISDGLWHVARAQIPAGVESAWCFAVMVRTGDRGNGLLEIDSLKLYDGLPENRLEQSMNVVRVSQFPAGFTPIPLPRNNTQINALRKYFVPESFPRPGRYDCEGTVFEITDGFYGTALKESGELTVELGNRTATELFLLLGARYTGNNSPAIARGRLSAVAEPERLLCEITYADGSTEELFPANALNGRHVVREGLGIYALVPSYSKPLQTLRIREQMENGALYLAAITINESGKRKLPGNWHDAPAYFKRNAAPLPELSPLQIDVTTLTVANNRLELSLDPNDPLRIRHMKNRITGEQLIDENSDAKLLTLDGEIRVENIRHADGHLILGVKSGDCRGNVRLSEANDRSGRIRVDANIHYTGREPRSLSAGFPSLKNLVFSKDSWWFYPKLGLSAGASNTAFSGRYGGVFPFQIMGFFSPAKGGGFHIQGLDEKNYPKDFLLKKNLTHGTLQIISCPITCRNGDPLKLAPFLLGTNSGDYRDQAKLYKQFLDSRQWVRRPVKQWLKDRFLLFEIYAHHGYYQVFDVRNGRFSLDQTVKLLKKQFGGIDMFHFFDFGLTKHNGRVGDYDYTGMLGAPGTLEQFLLDADQRYGIPTSLYIEGNLASTASRFAAEHNGRAGQRIGMSGEKLFYPGTTDEMFLCPEYPPWREHLNSLAARLLKQTNARAFYLDEYGYGGPDRVCYAENHEHAVPGYAMPGEMKVLARISDTLHKINPQYVILSEASPNDVNMQYQDGSLSSAISEYRESGNMARIDLYRYFFPEYKSFQIIALHDVIGDGYAPYKLVWFNGSGLMLSGDPTEDYSEGSCNFLRFMNASYRTNREYFSSNRVELDLPYGAPGVFVNEFTGKSGRLYTLFNANYRTVRKGTLRLPVSVTTGYIRIRDLFGKTLPVRQRNNVLEIDCQISPRGVGGVIIEFRKAVQP